MQLTRTFDILDNLKESFNKNDILVDKQLGEWVNCSVDNYLNKSNSFALGLIALGLTKGDKIATVSNNRHEWNIVDMGMAMIGVVHVPIYPTISDDEYRFILEHSDVKIVIVSDTSLYNRLKAISESIASINKIYTFNIIEEAPHWSEIISLGIEISEKTENILADIKQTISPTDLATIIYTSGTTGFPKGVMLCHQNIMQNIASLKEIFPFKTSDRALSFLPLCHIFERIANYLFQSCGTSIYYAENLGLISKNLVEIKATVFATVPRVIERIYDRIVAKGDELSSIQRSIFFWALKVGENYPVNGKKTWFYKLKLAIAQQLVFSKWQSALGGELRLIISGGAALQPRLSSLFFAANIPLLEGYGLSETSPVIAVNHVGDDNNYMIGTVGPCLKNVSVKIAEDGEILTKSSCVMMGYYKDDVTTQSVMSSDGWFHTGDIGTLINNKFLKITDRKKEMFKLTSGKYIAPQAIENILKESIFIEQAMVVGDNEKYASALISPNFDHLHFWATHHKIHFRDNKELVQNIKVLAQYQKEVAKVNKRTGKHEEINRFRLVCEAWTATTGELSPTLKLRRKFLFKKYSSILREIYSYSPNEENRGSIKFDT